MPHQRGLKLFTDHLQREVELKFTDGDKIVQEAIVPEILWKHYGQRISDNWMQHGKLPIFRTETREEMVYDEGSESA